MGVDGVVTSGLLLGLLLLLLLLVRVSLGVHLWLLHLWLLAGFYFEEGAHVGRRDESRCALGAFGVPVQRDMLFSFERCDQTAAETFECALE